MSPPENGEPPTRDPVTRRGPRSVRWLLYGSLGLYGLYWILATARELRAIRVDGAPSRGQWLSWAVLFGLTPVIALASFGSLWPTTGDLTFSLLVTGYLLVLPLLGVFYAGLRTRRAIYEFLGESPSLRREWKQSVLEGRCVIVYWQERLNAERTRPEAKGG